jgi:hypothetical protein
MTSVAIADIGVGSTIGLITAAAQVQFLGMPRWRVHFAYLDDLAGGRAGRDEGTDHFATN